ARREVLSPARDSLQRPPGHAWFIPAGGIFLFIQNLMYHLRSGGYLQTEETQKAPQFNAGPLFLI
ncbi:MAG: hypothetical protein P8M63_00485, partial [Paracoccaceae bacterium]|nr:hypothetical protein [Paracoccaceae bacterium]